MRALGAARPQPRETAVGGGCRAVENNRDLRRTICSGMTRAHYLHGLILGGYHCSHCHEHELAETSVPHPKYVGMTGILKKLSIVRGQPALYLQHVVEFPRYLRHILEIIVGPDQQKDIDELAYWIQAPKHKENVKPTWSV